jgi:hypothetical protein
VPEELGTGCAGSHVQALGVEPTVANAWGNDMYIERGAGGRILAAYLDQQYLGQAWLPIDSRALQAFLAAAPTVGKDVLGRRGLRLISRSISLGHVSV